MRVGLHASPHAPVLLDPDRVERIAVGVHDTATGEGGDGIVQVTDLQFVP